MKHLFQFDALKQYIEKGGNLLILLGEGGETRFDTNINFLLEDYGIMVNNGMRNNSALPLMHVINTVPPIQPSSAEICSV